MEKKFIKKVEDYKRKFTDKKILKLVNFLDVLYDWIESLHEKRRLSYEQDKDIATYLPKSIFIEFDKISATKISEKKYNEIKMDLLEESKKLIEYIISIAELEITDFDVFEFNLSQIFVKEEITTMIEWARVFLTDTAKRKEEVEKRGKIEEKRKEKEYLKNIQSLPQKELNKLVLSYMFDFTASSRTPNERKLTMEKNKEKVLSQKMVFRKFERKLSDATVDARKDAQNTVFSKIGDVKRNIVDIGHAFEEKAKIFVSEEGPKKKIESAREGILQQKKNLGDQLSDKGKDWKKQFKSETLNAQGRIQKRTDSFFDEVELVKKKFSGKAENMLKMGQREINKSHEMLLREKEDFKKDVKEAQGFFVGKAEEILEKGQAEIKKASVRVMGEKEDFKKDVKDAQGFFVGKAEEILEKGQAEIKKASVRVMGEKEEFIKDVKDAQGFFHEQREVMKGAKTKFVGKRDTAKERFLERGTEIQSKDKSRFIQEMDVAKNLFLQRSSEIKGQAGAHITGKKEKFIQETSDAQRKFLVLGKDRSKKHKDKITPLTEKQKLVVGAEKAEGAFGKQQGSMMARAQESRETMQESMNRRKELFLYDVRFAQDTIQKRAKEFAERIDAKREEFATKQEKIVARHKAHQKAHMIQHLLRTIRGMH